MELKQYVTAAGIFSVAGDGRWKQQSLDTLVCLFPSAELASVFLNALTDAERGQLRIVWVLVEATALASCISRAIPLPVSGGREAAAAGDVYDDGSVS